MPRIALTDRFIAGAKADSAQTDFFDSRTPGLALRVSAAGRKSWCLVFTAPSDGKRARVSLGTYPALALADARRRASEARGQLAEGNDPRHAIGGTAEMSVADLVKRYLADPDKRRLRSLREIRRRLERNALPIIGAIKLAQLTKRDVRDVTDQIMQRGARSQAWLTFKSLHAVFAWGVANEFLTHNPIAGVAKPGGFTAGERVLSDEEIKTLWQVLPTALSGQCVRVIQLCLITGQRLGEVCGMARAEIDFERQLWSLPGARTKNKHPHNVPLSGMALALIKAAITDAGASKFIFPIDDGGGALVAPVVSSTISRSQARFGIAPWSAHDLRRTALTGCAQLGVVPHVIAHIANHRSITKSGVTGLHYIRYSYEHETRAALDLWADRLTAIIGTGTAAAVVPMMRRG